MNFPYLVVHFIVASWHPYLCFFYDQFWFLGFHGIVKKSAPQVLTVNHGDNFANHFSPADAENTLRTPHFITTQDPSLQPIPVHTMIIFFQIYWAPVYGLHMVARMLQTNGRRGVYKTKLKWCTGVTYFDPVEWFWARSLDFYYSGSVKTSARADKWERGRGAACCPSWHLAITSLQCIIFPAIDNGAL